MLKKTIKYNENDMFINFPLERSGEFLGYQQEIDSYTQIKSSESINDVTDGEVIRFKKASNNLSLNAYFWYSLGNNYLNEYKAIGITYSDSQYSNPNYLNSFYILDFYDSYKPYEQKKIFTTYLTKLGNNNYQKYSRYGNVNIKDKNVSAYYIKEDSQIFYITPPAYFFSSSGDNPVMYLRLSFYNASNGELISFVNSNYGSNPYDPYTAYFLIHFNLKNGTWYYGGNENIVAYQNIKSEDYNNKMNNTFDNFDNLKQNYPDGNVFDYKTRNYENE